MNDPVLSMPVRIGVEIAVYLVLIFALIAWCVQILAPFVGFIAWGTVMAVAVYNAYLKLRAWVGGSDKLATLLFVLIGLAIVLVPSWMFADSLAGSLKSFSHQLETGQFEIPPANDRVKEWPLVGDKIYTAWSAAASDFEGWVEDHHDQLRSVLDAALTKAAGIGLGIVQFVASVIVAAVMLAHAEASRAMIHRFGARLAGEESENLIRLTAGTIRSVAVGVLGIAFIQAVLGGVGMMAVGIPAAGVWALLILILAIAQLPPLLVLLPAIIYVFSTNDNTTANVIFTIWSVVVSFLDAVLKPLLLGRGVEAPMPVILLGAIGGMLMSGIIGLFLGAVVLALGYRLFAAWVDAGRLGSQPTDAT